MAKATIGIIGGAGVAASAALVSRIEELATAAGAFRDQQHPEVVLYQATQAPSRSLFVEGRGESFVPSYLEATRRLAAFGAQRIAMCCNSAHVAIEELQAASGQPFIDLTAETLAELASRHAHARRVGIMCAEGTRISRIYDKRVARDKLPVELVYPDAPHQELITRGIINIKRGYHRRSNIPDRPQELFSSVADHLAGQDVEVILLACTEIPLALTGAQWNRLPLIDSIDVLARACLREAGVAYVPN